MKTVTTDPNVMGGAEVVAGTRIPVSTILSMIYAGHSIEEIAAEYPHLSEDVIRRVIKECHEN